MEEGDQIKSLSDDHAQKGFVLVAGLCGEAPPESRDQMQFVLMIQSDEGRE